MYGSTQKLEGCSSVGVRNLVGVFVCEWREDMTWCCFLAVFTPTKRWKGRVQHRKGGFSVDSSRFVRNKNTFEYSSPWRSMATMTVSTPDIQDVDHGT